MLLTQQRLTHQILHHFQCFKDLKQTFAVSRRAEQLCLRTKQRVVATVEESVLRTEMENIESEEEDAPKFGISPWGGWVRSDLIAGMRPGRLISGRHSLPLV